jgi:two-component system cell cycle sensor histidine kinase/response regulator CckA
MTQPSEHHSLSPISPAEVALRVDAAARTSGALAHELANILGAISTWVYILQEELGKESAPREEVGFMLETVESATRFINDLRAFAHPSSFGPDRTYLNAVVRGIEARLQESLPRGGRLELRLAGEALWVNGRVAALEPLIADLVARAADGLGENGTVVVETSRRGPDGGAGVRLVVRDDGRGLDPDRAQRFFEPFALGRVQGSGLRLSILYAAVRESGGVASVESSEAGTRVVVDLPSWQARAGQEPPDR